MTPGDHHEGASLSGRLPDKETVVETLIMISLLTLMVVSFSVLIALDLFLRL